jgi:hypothetical protein
MILVILIAASLRHESPKQTPAHRADCESDDADACLRWASEPEGPE